MKRITKEKHRKQKSSTKGRRLDTLQTRANTTGFPDLGDIRGQWHVKRALEVAAAGGHNILLVGPERSVQLALCLHSLLAQDSMLFLQDLDTFAPPVVTAETDGVSISLPEGSVVLPAQGILIATIKSCPCGFTPCSCSVEERDQYRQPFKDLIRYRFAIEVDVPLSGYDLECFVPEESSTTVRQRVESARAIQQGRYAGRSHLRVNADLVEASDVQHYCQMLMPSQDLVKAALRQLHLTSLESLRLQAVARTIADLDNTALIKGSHMAEAIQYLWFPQRRE